MYVCIYKVIWYVGVFLYWCMIVWHSQFHTITCCFIAFTFWFALLSYTSLWPTYNFSKKIFDLKNPEVTMETFNHFKHWTCNLCMLFMTRILSVFFFPKILSIIILLSNPIQYLHWYTTIKYVWYCNMHIGLNMWLINPGLDFSNSKP